MSRTGEKHGVLRILYLYPDTLGPSQDRSRNALHFLGQRLRGDVVAVTIPRKPNSSVTEKTDGLIGQFDFFSARSSKLPRRLRKLGEIANFFRVAMQRRSLGGPYDVIVAHGPYRIGLIAFSLSIFWKSPLMVEFPGHPLRGLALDKSKLGRLKRTIAPMILRMIVRRSNAIRLLYPSQLDDVIGVHRSEVSSRFHVFHEFVPLSSIERGEHRSQTILFVGFPWMLKGVDVLIRAFLRLAEDYPQATLQIIGYCADLKPWQELAEYHPRVQFSGPLPNEMVVQLMANAAMFVLPSRTEAMGRVLLEAMAAGTPVIASRVDGVPHYVRDGVDGLLFTSEDSGELEIAIRAVLDDPEQAQFRADAARQRVMTCYNEYSYAENFERAVRSALEDFERKSTSIDPI